MNAPRPVIPAEIEARRRAGSLAFRAKLPHASAQIRAAAAAAQAAIEFADLAAAHLPRSIPTLEQAVSDAVIAGLSGRPAPERGTAPEREQHAANVWDGVLRHLPPVGSRAPSHA